MADDITISEGTSTTGTIAADDVSGVKFQKIKLDIGADGVSSPYTGTTKELSNIVDGTIAEVGTVTGVGVLADGTVVVGGGTVQINPKSGGSSVIAYGTQIAGAGQTWATVSSVSGAGTFHYVQGCSIVCKSGTVDCFLGYGSALSGTNVIAKGNFSEGGGGIARNFSPSPLAGSGTNTELIVEIGGAGTVDFTVDFWRGT